MEKLMLKTIAQWTGGELCGDNLIISDISLDSRQISPETLFIAVKGERFDAHDFINEVQANGAKAVMCHKKVDCSIPVIYVKDTKKALLDLAREYRKSIDGLKVIGLTGSVGKTTTKEMTYCVVSKKYNAIKTEGNLNNEIGLPKTLFRLNAENRAAVIEMGMSNLGEISRLARTSLPDIGIITNVGVSHIENLGSRDQILRAKLEILDGMKKGSPLIINADNDKLITVKNDDYKIIYFGIENKDAHVRGEDIKEDGNSTCFTVVYGGGRQEVKLPTVGIHNVYDALSAFAVGLEIGIEPQTIADALSEYHPTGMRQRIKEFHGLKVIEDCYNASPDSQRAALNALKTIKSERKIAVLGDMLELGDYSKQAHCDIGKYVAKKQIDMLFTFGEEAINIAETAQKFGVEAYAFTDKAVLFNALKGELKKGDAVLFKASRGMKLEEVIEMLYKEWENK